MTEPHLEPWVYDLIIAIDDYEDEHPPADDHDSPCFGAQLGSVPKVQLDRARAIDYYRRHGGHDRGKP